MRWSMGDIVSYENNVMLVAVLSLLLVLLFILILHVYARLFFISAAQVFGPTHTTNHVITKGGLDPTVLESLPFFVYAESNGQEDEECAICLSAFEEEDKGRRLPLCSHVFHVQCVDMWLKSYANCPVCRAEVVVVVVDPDGRRNRTVEIPDGNAEFKQ